MTKSCLKSGSTRLSSRAGFTLIELLVVVAIIAILVGMVVGISGYASRKAATAKAVSEIEVIKTALEEYRINKGGYFPSSGALNSDLTSAGFSNQVGRYVGSGIKILDPWGKGYEYVAIGQNPTLSYRVYSRGATTSTFDDVDGSTGNF